MASYAPDKFLIVNIILYQPVVYLTSHGPSSFKTPQLIFLHVFGGYGNLLQKS